ncbi:Na+/H+ antiporter subunit E [Cucumibacter marinus]|uniref:Na+/H+ antiporter subunit E n=1 Tax=Cucumibacter marinus TaxID=1121252 RepID=UPI0004261666|nr:Na+/H+ antiporter subunit E [Cucumibacter marinus]
MIFFIMTATLALIWTAISGSFSLANLLLGAIIGLIAMWVIRERVSHPGLSKRLLKIVSLALLFLYELLISSIRVAILVLSPRLDKRLQPGIIAFPLTAKSDEEITLLANLITLTPGTLSVDVSEDRKFIYVHAIAVPDREALIADIANGFERKIIEVFE